MNMSFVLSVGSALLGGVLVAAGFSKLRALSVFVASIASYRVVPRRFHNLLARAIVVVEITVGVMLLAGLWPRWMLIVASLLLLAFLGANIWALTTGREVECHCFGVRDRASIRVSTIRSGGLSLFAILLAAPADASLPHVPDQVLVLISTAALGVIAALIAAMTSTYRLAVQSELERN